MSFAGSAGLDNYKINHIIGVPHPLELPFAIYGGRYLLTSSLRMTIKGRKRKETFQRSAKLPSPTTTFFPHHTYILTALLLTQQLLSIPLLDLSKPAGLDGRDFLVQFHIHHSHRIQQFLDDTLARSNEAPKGLKFFFSRSWSNYAGFILLARQT